MTEGDVPGAGEGCEGGCVDEDVGRGAADEDAGAAAEDTGVAAEDIGATQAH